MAPHGDASSVTFIQVTAGFTITLAVILFAIIGIVDGLKFRRIRLRYGVLIFGTLRGVPAQIIGGICVLVEGVGVALLINYIGLLRRYCGVDAGCFVTTPVTGLFAWPAILGNALVLFCFIYWLRGRHADVSPPSDKLSYSLPSVYQHVNRKLTVAHELRMNRPEVERIMEFVEERTPFVMLVGSKQVMDGRRLNPEKLAAVFLADKRFRDQGQRARIAVEAVTEAYATTRPQLKMPGKQQ